MKEQHPTHLLQMKFKAALYILLGIAKVNAAILPRDVVEELTQEDMVFGKPICQVFAGGREICKDP